VARLAQRLQAHAFWLCMEHPQLVPGDDVQSSVLTLEQLLRIGGAFVIPCDRHDTSTYTSLSQLPTVYLYENVPGGVGIAEKAFDVWQEILMEGKRLADKCPCEEGCPRCIHPPGLKSGHDLRKSLGITLADKLIDLAEAGSREAFDPKTYSWRSEHR